LRWEGKYLPGQLSLHQKSTISKGLSGYDNEWEKVVYGEGVLKWRTRSVVYGEGLSGFDNQMAEETTNHTPFIFFFVENGPMFLEQHELIMGMTWHNEMNPQ
jgi:hypothetical protein